MLVGGLVRRGWVISCLELDRAIQHLPEKEAVEGRPDYSGSLVGIVERGRTGTWTEHSAMNKASGVRCGTVCLVRHGRAEPPPWHRAGAP